MWSIGIPNFVQLVFLIIVTKITISTVDSRAVQPDYFEKYFIDRFNLIQSCENFGTGSNIHLNEKENQVNTVLMKLKKDNFDKSIRNKQPFLPAQHFFKAQRNISESKIFKIIQKLPKGGSLHTHDTAQVSYEYIFNLTYRDGLYGRITQDGRIELKFLNISENVDGGWENLKELRRQAPEEFDKKLKAQMTLVVENPDTAYPDINSVWRKFEEAFLTVRPIVRYKPVFKEYLFQAFEELYEDNVMYAELRASLSGIYDLDGKIYNHLEIAEMYLEVLNEFKKIHPKFHGVKIIFATNRNKMKITESGHVTDGSQLTKHVSRFLEVRKKYPHLVVGFDIVGQEDIGTPLMFFLPYLEYLKKSHSKFFFHAGETNWFGEISDHNLFDAILLNTTRIGHGYAIVKHPRIQEIVREREIAIEISPISNQVLKLVEDIRNHPGTILLANGLPVVITSDDPTFWGAKGLSYDWYMAFMGMASKDADLRLLKQLAINSIVYSSMEEHEKIDALKIWQDDWEMFIENILLDRRYWEDTQETVL